MSETLPAARVMPGVRKLGGLERVSNRSLGLRPRELRLIHSIRRQNDIGRPGQYRLDRDLFDSLDAVFLSVQPYRILLEGDENRARTVCASADCVTPDATVSVPKAVECGVCDFGQWDRSAMGKPGGKAKPPKCMECFAVIGIQHQAPEATPFYLLLKKSGAYAFQGFLREANNVPKIGQLHELVIRLTAQEQKGDGGFVWYVPIFTITQTIDPGEYHELAELAKTSTYTPPVDAGAIQTDDADPPPDVAVPVAPAPAEDQIPF